MEKKVLPGMPDLKGFYFEESLVLHIFRNGSKKGHHVFLTYEDEEEGLGFFCPLIPFL